jgi:hypothetical protein
MSIKVVVFTGIPGLDKRRILSHLRSYILREHEPDHSLKALTGGDLEQRFRSLIPIVELCRLTKEDLRADLSQTYDLYVKAQGEFRNNIRKVLERGDSPLKIIFIHTHLTHCIDGHYRTWLALRLYDDVFRDLKVIKVVNLIDNIHTIRHSLGSPLHRLNQLITWRDLEQMASELLTGKLFPDESVYRNCKVVSVNHSLSTFADLILDPSKPEIYTAYPISKIRHIYRLQNKFSNASRDEALRMMEVYRGVGASQDGDVLLLRNLLSTYSGRTLSEVKHDLLIQNDEFRRFFSQEFVAYDPSTIDEIPLLAKAEVPGTGNTIRITEDDFWPYVCEPEKRLAGRDAFRDARDLGGIEIDVEEIKELSVARISDYNTRWSTIRRQVRSRDFRLIDQSLGLVAYRPTLGGRWSEGVFSEIDHVYRHLRRPFFVIKDRNDGPLDRQSTLHWEFGPNYFKEWDLSIAEQRREAFIHARTTLMKRIEDMNKGDVI